MGAGRFTRVSLINEPIEFDGVTICSGDVVVADQDGVVVVAVKDVERVAAACKVGVAQDEKCREAIKRGSSIKEAFAKFRT